MKVLIYGAGALGQAMGCMLAAAGHEIELLLRKRFISVLQQEGLRVGGVLGDYAISAEGLKLLAGLDGAADHYDYILLTTKSYDTETAARHLSSAGVSFGYLVSMQNGCGNLEILGKTFSEKKLLGARVITGFEISSPGTVKVTVTADAIHIGGLPGGTICPAAERLARIIEEAGHPCIAVADIHLSLYAKLLYNCALNPLGAILGVHYGALADSEVTCELMNRVIDETLSVIHALGGRTPWQNSADYQRVFYEKLVPATYNHRASMLQDIENGKKTEVDALVGYVSRQGRAAGVATPVCDVLQAMVRFKQAHHGRDAA